MHWQQIPRRLPSTLILACLAACGDGADGSNGSDGTAALVATSTEAAGSHCAAGGTRIDSGADANGNGVLDADEITGTQFVCNGAAGATGAHGASALYTMTAEPAGSHCSDGGTKITAGTDADANGVLDSVEVSSTAYVCRGATGAAGAAGHSSLMAMSTEAAGANCTYGGSKITSGLDVNDDGSLSASEVTATSYVCNGSGVNWTNVTSAPAVQMSASTGYIANNVTAETSFTLPASPSVGDIVRLKGRAAPGWVIAQNSGQSIDLSGLTAYSQLAGQTWSLIKNTGSSWETSVAASADGQTLMAVPHWDTNAFRSTDGGTSWTTMVPNAGDVTLADITLAPDASLAYVRSFQGSSGFYVYDGISWQQRTTMIDVIDMAAFNGGVVALGNVGGVVGPYLSTDRGATWTALTISAAPASPCWASIAVSPDGQSVVVGGDGNGSCPVIPVFISHDQGATWVASPSSTGPAQNRSQRVAISANANTVVVASTNGGLPVFVSNDGGNTWINSNTQSALYAQANGKPTVSANGHRILLPSGTSNTVYVSNNAGISWSTVAMSYGTISLSGNSTLSTVFAGTNRSTPGLVLKSSSVLSTTSTASTGTAGSVSGGARDALELQYLGSGQWGLLSGIGSDFLLQ